MSGREKNFPQKFSPLPQHLLRTSIVLSHGLKPAQFAHSFYYKTCLFLPIRVDIKIFWCNVE